jgi:hypothetical protein
MVDLDGRVKVADFGLAKLASDDNATLLTHSHVRMGTPDFMAPEALQGMSHVDHRADLYAVGAMLYQMLTGEVPRGRFELPSARRPGVDSRFDAIVDRAMQKDPEKRYSSATDLRSDLENIRSQPALPASLPPETAKAGGSDTAAASAPRRRRGKLSARLGGCSLTLALAFCVALFALPQIRELIVGKVLIPKGELTLVNSAPAPENDATPAKPTDVASAPRRPVEFPAAPPMVAKATPLHKLVTGGGRSQPFIVAERDPNGNGTGAKWPTYAPGQAPPARGVSLDEAAAFAGRGEIGERLYLLGEFRVTASGGSRAVLRDANRTDQQSPRIVVEYSTGTVPPHEQERFVRDASRPYLVSDVRHEVDGAVTIYVREIINQ